MTTLRIPDAALAQHIAILGMTGSGKTFAAKGVVESLLAADRHCCIVDPTGAWWGLRLGRDGKSRGHDVILIGGDHADIPLSERSGEAVARLIVEQRASVIIDTSGMTVGEHTRWFVDFAGALYRLNRSPLQLIIDEAHTFAPQGGAKLSPDTAKMLHATNRLMSGGRSRGIRAMLITQRPAKLHKDSLTCAATLIAMRVIAPQDRGAIKDWIDGAGDPTQGKAVLDSLAQLGKGEGWVWHPEGRHLERGKFPAIKTFDSSATPDGDTHRTVKPGEIDLDAVKAAMAEAVAEAEANDPKALRAKIAELEQKLREVKPVADPAAIERACAARDEHWRNVVRSQTTRLNQIAHRLRGAKADVEAALDEAATNNVELHAAKIIGTKQPATEFNTPKSIRPGGSGTLPRSKEPATAGNGAGNFGNGERVILTAIAQHPAGVTREQLTILTGYKRSSRDTFLQRLRAAGYMDGSETITATPAGVAALGSDFERLPTGDRLREYWLGKLTGGERVIFEVVCRAYPHGVNRTAISEATEYQRSSRDTYLQRLSARKLIVSTRDGVKAASELFGG